MIIENSDALKAWLTSCLGRMCDAEPGALAKYIIALIKKDKVETQLKAFCLQQLDVFLLKETKNFVDLLFEALKSKSYLNPDHSSIFNDTNESSSPSSVCESNLLKQQQSVLTSTESVEREEKDKNFEYTCKKDTNVPQRSFSPEKSSSRLTRDIELKRSDDLSRRNEKKGQLCKNKRNNTSERERDKYEGRSDKNESELYLRNSRRFYPRSRSNSSDKNESPSYSLHSRSRSKSKDRCKDIKKNIDIYTACDHGDTDYRLNPTSQSNYVSSQSNPVSSFQNDIIFRKGGRRCKDYDEKGYCMLGDLCLFDHGNDPVVVEDVSALNFGVPTTSQDASPKKPNMSSNLESFSSLQFEVPPPPTSPPPLPPPPPPSATPPPPPPSPGIFVPEPYNPEAPEMNIACRDQPNYYIQQSLHHSSPVPPHSIISPISSSVSQTAFYNPNQAPSYSCNEVQKARELLDVPTADEKDVPHVQQHSFCFKEDNKDSLENSLLSAYEKNQDAEYPPKIEIAKSVISNVKQIVGKRKAFDYNRLGPNRKSFKFDNDVSRCTLEIKKIPKNLNTIELLNNHFCKFGTVVNLKIGYKGDLESALVQFMTPAEANAAFRSTEAVFNNRFIKVFRHNKLGLTGLDISQKPSHTSINNTPVESDIEQPVSKSVVFSTKGNLSRTIFNPTVLKKNNIHTEAVLRNQSKKSKEDKDSTSKLIELHKKKQIFLQRQVQCQRVILEKLNLCKNKKEKDSLKQIIQDMGQKISTLEIEVKKDAEDLMKVLKGGGGTGTRNKTEAEKELLDAELDLYNKQHTGDDISELLSKVYELKKKAKAMGLLGPPNSRNKNRGKKVLTSAPYPIKSSSGSSISFRSIDHRTRKVLVSSTAAKEDLQNYFLKFGEIESIDQDQESCIVTFKTRKEAETVFKKGIKHEDYISSVAWHQEASTSSVKQDDNNIGAAILEKIDQPELATGEEEEDEDEEDCETRSWRH